MIYGSDTIISPMVGRTVVILHVERGRSNHTAIQCADDSIFRVPVIHCDSLCKRQRAHGVWAIAKLSENGPWCMNAFKVVVGPRFNHPGWEHGAKMPFREHRKQTSEASVYTPY